MELEEPETGHARTIEYNSKLEMKKRRIQVRPSNTMWPRYLKIDIYYPAKYGSLCSFTAETFSTCPLK